MRKLTTIVIVLVLFGCNDQQKRIADALEKKDTVEVKQVSEKPKVEVDSLSIRLNNQLRYLDSNRYYASKCDEYKEKMYQAQIDYLTSGENQKYEKLYYKYQRMYNYYVNKTNRFNDSLQNNTLK